MECQTLAHSQKEKAAMLPAAFCSLMIGFLFNRLKDRFLDGEFFNRYLIAIQ